MSEALTAQDLESGREKTAQQLSYEEASTQDSDSNKEEPEYPPTSQVIVIILAIYLATLLVALDQTIIGVAIPKITDQFKSIPDIAWYGSAYFLTSTALQPSYGRIYKILSVSTLQQHSLIPHIHKAF